MATREPADDGLVVRVRYQGVTEDAVSHALLQGFDDGRSSLEVHIRHPHIQTAEIEELVEKKFAGSIPAFLTAFTKSQQLTADEIQEMQQMIDRFRKEHPDD